jgi:hypothetical protein
MGHDALTEDLKAVTESLSSVMIQRTIPLKTVLMGMQAFLVALQTSGHAKTTEISEELSQMAAYFRSLAPKN